MYRVLPVMIVFVAVALSGVLSGVWTHRWAPTASLESIEQATQLPLVAGDWDGREQPTLPAEIKAAQASAIVRRLYVNRQTGHAASVMLISGRPGPVSVHVPEVCFSGNGYEQVGPRTRVSIPESDGAQFWLLKLRKDAAVPAPITVHYAWANGGSWQAPDNPRVAFAGQSTLFKLYVVCDQVDNAKSDATDPVSNLLRALLPLLRVSLPPTA